MYYLIYQTTCMCTNKSYIGQHVTKNINDRYLGSGVLLNQDIKLFGKDQFYKEILFIYDNFNDMNNKEIELVSNMKNTVSVKDKENNFYVVDKDDPRYLTGELFGNSRGMVNVKDIAGNRFRVSINDPQYISGELKHIVNGTKNKKLSTTKWMYNNQLKINARVNIEKVDAYLISNWILEFNIKFNWNTK